jgi:hypothetical protein
MRKAVVSIAAAICWNWAAPPKNFQIPAPDTAQASLVGPADLAKIISSAIAARFLVTRETEPYVDECSIRRLLGSSENSVAALRPDVRQYVLPSNPSDCSGDSDMAQARDRLIFKRVTVDTNGAVLECSYSSPGIGAHVENYKLRKSRSSTGNTWAVMEIRMFNFASI